jgi:hypothetical protein
MDQGRRDLIILRLKSVILPIWLGGLNRYGNHVNAMRFCWTKPLGSWHTYIDVPVLMGETISCARVVDLVLPLNPPLVQSYASQFVRGHACL